MQLMTTATKRKKLIAYIAHADDKKIKGMYLLVEDDIENAEKFELSAENIKMLEIIRERHTKGRSKSFTWPEAKQIIRSKKKI